MTSQGTADLRVLIADDEIEIRELLGEYLTARGHIVHTAQDGREALSWLERNPVDVLLTDVQMPNISGVELVSALRSRCEHIGVVVMTGVPDVESAATAMKMGASDYLLKPFRLQQVFDAVVKAAGWGQAERALARLKQRSSLIEDLLLAAPPQRRRLLQARLPDLLSSEAGLTGCALWLREGEDWSVVIAPSRDIHVEPHTVTDTVLTEEGASIRLPGGAGVLALAGQVSPEDLERIERIAAILTAALGR